MTASVESKLDVVALGYDNYRIMRDNADRSLDYLKRLVDRGGRQFDNDWWISLPEPVYALALEDLADALKSLSEELQMRMDKTKEEAQKIVTESRIQLDKSIDVVLYNLAQKQIRERKAMIKDLDKMGEDAIEEGVIESMRKLPVLEEGRSWQYEGKQAGKPMWSVIDTPKIKTPVKNVKTIFKLNRRPKK